VNEAGLEQALAHVVRELRARARRFALVGGLAVSIRAEVRFTRDVDLAIHATSDADVEALVRGLASSGYAPLAVVEQDAKNRLATVRLRTPSGVVVDFLAASSGIEEEVVVRATEIDIDGVGPVLVARAEELLALKVLSMTERRPQDAIDAESLLTTNPALDLQTVRDLLGRITARGFDRGEDLEAKFRSVLARGRRGPHG
jgi:predicted nucleotidyltransferase